MEGSWVVNVNQPGFPPSQRLFTFFSDGTIIGHDVLQAPPSGVEWWTTAHGEWIRNGNREFNAIVVGLRFNGQANMLGMFKIRMSVRLKDSLVEWEGPARIDVTGVADN